MKGIIIDDVSRQCGALLWPNDCLHWSKKDKADRDMYEDISDTLFPPSVSIVFYPQLHDAVAKW